MIAKDTIAVMFHSVGLDQWQWRSAHIAEPLKTFERKIAALARAGWQSVSIEEVYNDKPDGTSKKKVLLTFDDGYLDNWVHVFPVLEKYGMKATIFVNPDFVDNRNIVRPQLAPGSICDKDHLPNKCCAGFLSWPEMRLMEESGLIDIQSHALTHTWYFKGPEIVDFWHPGAATEPAGPIWMLWNRFPDFKPFYLTEAAKYELRIPYGTPIYEHGKSLVTRRYFPDERSLTMRLVEYVERHGGVAFFNNSKWRMRLQNIVERHRISASSKSPSGHYESDAEYQNRVQCELSSSKETIEKKLNKRVEALCWPGGGVTEDVLDIARKAGYRYFTLPSAWKPGRAKGKYMDMIPRIGSMSNIVWHGLKLGRPTGKEFIWNIEGQKSSFCKKWLGRSAKAVRIAFIPVSKIIPR